MVQIPQSLEDAITVVKDKLQGDIEFVVKNPEHTVLNRAHHGLGMWIRNSWGFWRGSNANLVQELKILGLNHPDDMSSLIIQCAIRDIKGEDRDIQGTVQFYKDYWANANAV